MNVNREEPMPDPIERGEAPERCPTCESDDPAIDLDPVHHDNAIYHFRSAKPCPDSFHAAPASTQEEEGGEARDNLERGGEQLAVAVRGYLAEAAEDNPDHPVWNGPLAQGLKAWNQARNALRPTSNEYGPASDCQPDTSVGEERAENVLGRIQAERDELKAAWLDAEQALEAAYEEIKTLKGEAR